MGRCTPPACRPPSPLQELRALLQGGLRSAEGADVFSLLFASWSHSCAASLALALLAQVGAAWTVGARGGAGGGGTRRRPDDLLCDLCVCDPPGKQGASAGTICIALGATQPCI